MSEITTWRVTYYVSPSGSIPVRDFLDGAGPQSKTKALRILQHAEEYGLQGITSYTKKLSGTSLWEIRIIGRDNVRILFVTCVEKEIVLLHGFYKKSQKTPRKDIDLALERFHKMSKGS